MPDKYHSVTFGDKNTWDDWHLVPMTRPVILPPQAKTSNIEIPGTDGYIDTTELLTGRTMYKNRTGNLEFYVMNGYHEWYHIYSEILNYLHGQEMKVILDDEPWFYYTGRFSVNTWKSEKDHSRIVIDYTVEPYKIPIQSSSEDWLWDPFDFEIGIVREYGNIRVNDKFKMDFYGSRKLTIPKINVTLDNEKNPITMVWSGLPDMTFSLHNGENSFPDIKIKDEVYSLTFKGKGVISVDYRGGSL